jgi:hypothetical protein
VQAWRLSGDQYVEKGGKPWISEMYGYVYAAAKMDVWHKVGFIPVDCLSGPDLHCREM